MVLFKFQEEMLSYLITMENSTLHVLSDTLISNLNRVRLGKCALSSREDTIHPWKEGQSLSVGQREIEVCVYGHR